MIPGAWGRGLSPGLGIPLRTRWRFGFGSVGPSLEATRPVVHSSGLHEFANFASSSARIAFGDERFRRTPAGP